MSQSEIVLENNPELVLFLTNKNFGKIRQILSGFNEKKHFKNVTFFSILVVQ